MRRQYGIGEYIADFYIPSLKLVIEIDGDSHFTDNSREYDLIREQYMQKMSIRTIRYTNLEVLSDIEAIFSDLLKIVQKSC